MQMGMVSLRMCQTEESTQRKLVLSKMPESQKEILTMKNLQECADVPYKNIIQLCKVNKDLKLFDCIVIKYFVLVIQKLV